MKTKPIALIAIFLLAISLATCKMDVNEVVGPSLFLEPYITTQPASISYFPGEYSSPPTLTVESDGWTSGDGSLIYQWYQFDTIAQYLKGESAPVGDGTNTYTPPSLKTTPGSRNYFYVVIKQSDISEKAENQVDTIRSNVAVISFNEANKPAIPLLTGQPMDGQARFGRTLNPLSVRVNTSGTGTAAVKSENLFYQWYQVDLDAQGKVKDSDNDGFPDVTILDGEIYSDYTPAPLWRGKGYFFVEVTHNIGYNTVDANGRPVGGDETIEISVPATIEVLAGLNAAAPVITEQPRSTLYFTNEDPDELEVIAYSPDLGKLSYQWYKNDQFATTTGERTAVGTDSPSLDVSVTGSGFYYVEVTSTSDYVVPGGVTTATTTSRAVNVRTTTPVDSDTIAAVKSTITIGDPSLPANRFNYVRGYGGMEVAWANFPETFPDETELMYNPDKLGYNMLRIMMPVSNVNIDLAMDDLVNVTKRRPHYYDNVKIVNKYGGYVAAAPWSPPKEWKSNNSINGGGILRHEYYKQYAAYLKSFAQHMYNRGAPIFAISIQNEPNYTAGYDGCEWTPNEMRDFFREVGVFTDGVKGWGGGKQTPRVLTMNGESANNVNINDAAINDPKAYAAIDVFSRHVYGERRTNLWTTQPQVQQVDKKEVWMMEHNINSANAAGYVLDSQWNYIWRFMNDVDLVMRLNNENAFVWWASKRFYSMVGDGQYGTVEGAALPRGWGLSHYAKYTIDTTRIGFTMTGTTVAGTAINYTADADSNPVVNGWGTAPNTDMDNTTARITAYVSADGNELSMVMWTPTLNNGTGGHDLGTIQIDMPSGFEIGSVTAIKSYSAGDNRNTYQEFYDVQVSQNRDSAYVTLNHSQIMSVKFTRR